VWWGGPRRTFEHHARSPSDRRKEGSVRTFKRTLAFTAASFLVIAAVHYLAPTTADAQGIDHLKCYKVKDPVRLKGPKPSWLDLTGVDGRTEQCRIVGGFRLVCVPVHKEVTAPIERKLDGKFEEFVPVPSDDLSEEDKLCYKIRCLSSGAADRDVTDQFGSRTVSKPKPFLLCGPIHCTSAETSCAGRCVGLQSDPGNCGACANECANGQSCDGGVCG